ncbi:MAG: aspartate/glutamate racemase family protein [Betaproteobacteria bacterium]|nr:aspartate/glutamate racemase family protein [Betaproteobacteria bacterium]
MRIWYQSTTEIENYHGYREALRAHFARIANPDTEVTLRGTPVGTWGGLAPSDVMKAPYAYHMILSRILFDGALQAEAEGYDAFILGSFTDPWLRELRSAVDIPVVSLLESTLLVGCTVAPRLGLVTMNTENEWFLQSNIAAHRLESRISGVYVVQPEMTEWELNTIFTDPAPYVARFTEVARRAVASYADAIVPAEGLVAEVVATCGLKDVDGAPVLDAIASAICFAEMAVKLHKRTGLHAGRRWNYTRANDQIMRFAKGAAAIAR